MRGEKDDCALLGPMNVRARRVLIRVVRFESALVVRARTFICQADAGRSRHKLNCKLCEIYAVFHSNFK